MKIIPAETPLPNADEQPGLEHRAEADQPPASALFGSLIGALAANSALQDPFPALDLLMNGPDTIPLFQVDKLWRLAVRQSALADVRGAMGDYQYLQWQEAWTQLETTLRDVLVKTLSGVDEFEQKTSAYVNANRAAAALPAFVESVRRLEGILKRQRALVAFHWNEDHNSYYRREAELRPRLAATLTPEDVRLSAAKQLLEEAKRYRGIYIPKLQAVAREVDQAETQCQALMTFFCKQTYPDIHRWDELTRTLIESRKPAVEHINLLIDLDVLMPNEIASGKMLTMVVDGQPTLALSRESTSRMKEYCARLAVFLKSSLNEQQVEAERNPLVTSIVGERQQDFAEPEPNPEVSARATQETSRRTHPLERRAWFRLAKVLWWGALVLWAALSWIAFPSGSASMVAILVGVIFFYGIKAAAFYVVLGRTTLRERDGSGYIDLEAFEDEVYERSAVTDDRGAFEELRAKFGRRVPAQILRVFVDKRLSDAVAEKRRVIAEADRKGTTVSIDSLRASFMSSAPTVDDLGEYQASRECLLLRLEIEHGSEIPVSVVAALVDIAEVAA